MLQKERGSRADRRRDRGRDGGIEGWFVLSLSFDNVCFTWSSGSYEPNFSLLR